jgi:hypothetical protein
MTYSRAAMALRAEVGGGQAPSDGGWRRGSRSGCARWRAWTGKPGPGPSTGHPLLRGGRGGRPPFRPHLPALQFAALGSRQRGDGCKGADYQTLRSHRALRSLRGWQTRGLSATSQPSTSATTPRAANPRFQSCPVAAVGKWRGAAKGGRERCPEALSARPVHPVLTCAPARGGKPEGRRMYVIVVVFTGTSRRRPSNTYQAPASRGEPNGVPSC